jgi:hypothetical protein
MREFHCDNSIHSVLWSTKGSMWENEELKLAQMPQNNGVATDLEEEGNRMRNNLSSLPLIGFSH